MIKIDMQMPDCCIKCPFYRGSWSGGSCSASEPDGLYFGNELPDCYRHDNCPLQEVEDDTR